MVDILVVVPPNLSSDPISLKHRILGLLNMEKVIKVPDENPIYRNPRYYYEGAHLQTEGVQFFTQYLATEL